MNYFDSHAHYDDKRFKQDREELLRELLPSCGVSNVINVGCDVKSSEMSIHLAEKYDYIYAAVGVHPHELYDMSSQTIAKLKKLSEHKKVVAIGEIGLDYYYDTHPKELQRFWFRQQLRLAEETNLPVIIHSRDAAEDTMNIMQQAHKDGIPGVIHCYSYSKEMAKEYVKMGYYIGVGGVVTFKNAKKLKETVAEIGLPHIVLETDCPYMAPEPHRGTRNDSRNLIYVVKTIAELTGTTPEEVEAVTWENAKKLFQKVK